MTVRYQRALCFRSSRPWHLLGGDRSVNNSASNFGPENLGREVSALIRRKILTKAFHFFENRIGRSGANKGARFGIVGSDKLIDALRQFFLSAQRGATVKRLLHGVQSHFHQVESRGVA